MCHLFRWCFNWILSLVRCHFNKKCIWNENLNFVVCNQITVCAYILLSDFPFDGSILLMYSIRKQFLRNFKRTDFCYFLDAFGSSVCVHTHFHHSYGTMMSHLLHFHPVKGTILLQYLKFMDVCALYIWNQRDCLQKHTLDTAQREREK